MSNFHDIASTKGWSKGDQVAVLLDYIDRQGSPEAFQDYLAEQDGYDDGLQSFEVVALWPGGGSWSEDVRARDTEEAESEAKDTMADNSGIPFDDDEQREDFKNAITIVSCL